ncbi:MULTISPECIES: hypothetical protein [Microcoleaceae]|uniref:hypothetical protein n=1 Tax=Microcoleaceae TaxID=1892252 RepID=UPI00187DFA3D|nr:MULTISPECIES: hypothetical protein [unclassified Tychonema]MBE9124029.1 hypothetical protein [Tychonema sp. LEGE 07199]MBE9135307.1 hypothetical protein [Tychonema sp. LEGE 07196]MBE9164106.1 hypothetical protein [Tychonema sp. LEGE 06208]
MANYSPIAQQPQAAEPIELCEDSEIWGSLKSAIGASSGFQRWQLELNFESKQKNASIDQQVRSYLRETLATLAY